MIVDGIIESAHVIVVDDEESVRGVLKRMLEPAGYRVSVAATAEAALRIVEQAPASVAFVDVHLPGANGLWLAEQIRAIAPTTAMILATGDADLPPVETLRPGIMAYLVKPFTHKRVVETAAAGVRWSADATSRGAESRRPAGLLEESEKFFDE